MIDVTTLPVIPLREAVLFPGVTSPIAAGRPGTLRAIEAALKTEDKMIFVVAQRENLEDVSPEILYQMGTAATIGPVQRGPSGMRLLLNGVYRGVAMRFDEEDEYLVATVRQAEEMSPLDPAAPEFTALYAEARERASELGRRAGMPKEAVQQFLAETKEPGRFADLVAGHLDLKPMEAQRLLEGLSVEERLRSVLLHIQRQIDVIDAQESIKSQVQEELGDRHREAFLRQQLKAIQKELGEDGGREDLEELKEKLDELSLPETARKEVDREMSRLERMGPEGMEAQVIRTYLETISELPWDEHTDERLDISKASEILEEDHYGLGEVKDRILEFLSVRLLQLRSEKAEGEAESVETTEAEETETTLSPTLARDAVGRNPILLFAGPPGVGKTSVAQSIARAMGREYVRISLGGVRDEADIRGHRRTYVGAMPGRIIHGMKQAGSRNPVFLLDEVDKLGVSYQGDPGSALLEVLDPAQNDTFTDHYLGVPFDLSEVQFICTANFLQNIPGPLQDRSSPATPRTRSSRSQNAISSLARSNRPGSPTSRSPSKTARFRRSSLDTPGSRAFASSNGRSAVWPERSPGRSLRTRSRTSPSGESRLPNSWAGPRSTPSTPPSPTRSALPPGCTTHPWVAISCSSRPRPWRARAIWCSRASSAMS